jgi:hypothetical protein
MGYVFVFMLVAVVAVVYVRRRARRRMLDLKLALVGFEASGKTVFSGCMFHEMRVPGREGIFLDTTPENASSLLALYNATADTDAGFPGGTAKGELREWSFTVKARSAAGVAEVARFSYLDFAGESLREMYGAAPNPQTRQLHARFTGADVLMGILDGLEVKHYLEGRPGPKFHEDLGSLLALLSNHRKAVNFVLTKWDLIEDEYSFRHVIERLLQIEIFARFVQSQELVGTCRLIPVSSVGPGFVVEEGDEMLKNPGKQINPVRVELPIACALPDAVISAQNGPRTPSPLLDWAKAVRVNVHLPLGIIDVGLDRRRPDPTATTTAKTPMAVAQLIRYCYDRISQFDRDFPESHLVHFTDSRER